MKTFKIISICIFLAALSGCNSLPKYPDYSGSESSTLCGHRDPNPFNSTPIVTITAIDGVRTNRNGCKTPFILKPGPYEVAVHLNILRSEFFTVKPTIEANKNYRLKGKTQDGRFEAYLFEESSGEITPLERIN